MCLPPAAGHLTCSTSLSDIRSFATTLLFFETSSPHHTHLRVVLSSSCFIP